MRTKGKTRVERIVAQRGSIKVTPYQTFLMRLRNWVCYFYCYWPERLWPFVVNKLY